MELKEMQLQCDILTSRREEFLKRCSDIDEVVEDTVKGPPIGFHGMQDKAFLSHGIRDLLKKSHGIRD